MARTVSLGTFDEKVRSLRELEEEFTSLRREGEPAAFVTSADLVARGAKPGPEFGLILKEAERMQLDGVLETRAAAIEWLERRVRQGKPRAD
jgi:hypothetical protein